MIMKRDLVDAGVSRWFWKMRNTCRPFVCGWLITGMAVAAMPAAGLASVERYDILLEKVQTAPRNVTEDEVIELLRLSQSIARPYPVSLAVAQYLAQQRNVSPTLMALSAKVAALSGDLRTAVSRYKSTIGLVRPGEASSNIMAELYSLLIHILADHDDAYRTMTDDGPRFRESVRARQFDAWYLDMARAQKDYLNHARRLAMVMVEKMPIEQERLHFWRHLDWLLNELSTSGEDQRAILAEYRRLIPLIRDDAYRTAYAKLVAANLEFYAGSYADETARIRAFSPVLQAARESFDARPTLENLQSILILFGGGPEGFRHDTLRELWDQKSELLVHAFPKLDGEQRHALVAWEHGNQEMVAYVASPTAWSEIAANSGGWFKGRKLPDAMRFGVKEQTLEGYRAAARGLDGVPHPDAAVINSLARGRNARQTVDHLMQHESWHLGFNQVPRLINGPLWEGWCKINGKEPDDARPERDALNEYYLNRYLANSPAAVFDSSGVRDALFAAWRMYEAADGPPLAMIETLKKLNWLPYDSRTRNEVMGGAYSEYTRWARDVRRNHSDNEALMNAATSLDEAFREARELEKPTPDAVDNRIAQSMAKLQIARREGNEQQIRALANEVFEAVRKAESGKVPFGLALLENLAQRGRPYDGFDMQIEMLKKLLADYRSGASNIETTVFVDGMMSSRNWRFWHIGRSAERASLQMSSAFGEALNRLIDQNRFDRTLLNWMRGTHQGHRWANRGHMKDVMARVIREKEKGNNKALDEAVDTITLMRIVQHNITDLQSDFHHERYFDDMFIRESIARGSFAWRYWETGRDHERKVVNAAARVFKDYAVVPVGYGSTPESYSIEDFWRWQERLLRADEQPRNEMLTAIESHYGKTRFDAIAMGRGTLDTMTVGEGNRAEYFELLRNYIGKANSARVRMPPPLMSPLRSLFDNGTFTETELNLMGDVLTRLSPMRWSSGDAYPTLALALQSGIIEQNQPQKLMPLLTEFWRVSRDTGSAGLQRALADQARRFLERNNQHMAAAYALTGTEVMGGRLPDDVRTALQSLRTRAVAGMARIIPVDRNDRRYPAFEAQLAYLTGRSENAWTLYEPRTALVREIFRELDPQFCIWLINRHSELGDFEPAEALVRPMILWMDENPSGFDPEIRAGLYVSHADIAFRRQEYPRARALFERIAATEDFSGTRSQRFAQLRVAEVDRLTRNYDRAESLLDELTRRHDPFLQAEGNLLLSRIKYDQEYYEDAMEYLNKVFAINPNHPDARIMQGELFLRIRRFMEATELDVGPRADQRILVPGRPLRIRIEDPNLAIVGQAANIEITVRTTAGDEETFPLMPFGETRDRFEGQIMTELGRPVPGDGVLQVLGSDEITYDFSDRFKAAAGQRAAANNR